MWNNALSRLPDNYSREGQVNNKKLHQVVYAEYEEIKNVFEDIKASRDIDQAYGKTLDLIGGNVQQPRGVGEDDELYRLMIKTKIIANLSQGDIETINEIGKAVLGDSFVSVKETWSDPAYNCEPAGLVFTLKSRARIIPSTIERAVAGGVGTYWILILHEEGIYTTTAAFMGEKTTIRPKIKTNLTGKANIHQATAITSTDRAVLRPLIKTNISSKADLRYSAMLASTDEITLRPRIKTKLPDMIQSSIGSTMASTERVVIYPHIANKLNTQVNACIASNATGTEKTIIHPRKEVF